MNKINLLIVILSTFIITACAHSGTKIQQHQVEKLIEGKTTLEEAIAIFGKPINQTLMPDGRKSIMWSYLKTQPNAAMYIPVVGLFAGKMNTDMDTLQAFFNEDNILDQYMFSNTGISAGTL